MPSHEHTSLVPSAEAEVAPPPETGPGGELGIGAPWDMAAPVETRQEYASRIRQGPDNDAQSIAKARASAEYAARRGDKGFARLRTEDTKDKAQGAADRGDRFTWLILGGACALFLLFMLLMILLPHGRDAHMPNIRLY